MRVDSSQYEAVKHSLSHRVALIQGPPGTGKTFIGSLIVKLLLLNKPKDSSPILMICYKNQALDRFIEICVHECNLDINDIYRIGSNSKNPNSEKFKFVYTDELEVIEKSTDLSFQVYACNSYSRRLYEGSESLVKIQQTYDDYQRLREENIANKLKTAKVLAMTSSYASIYKKILQKVNAKIILFEEAAEIFESHIVSLLTSKTKHIIQIGDHIQLSPKPNSIKLAKICKLNVSMFERLIKNGISHVSLKYQHRMHPFISSLINNFYNHELVNMTENSLEKIKGMKQSVFFIDHDKHEDIHEGTSKSNKFEVLYATRLCNYLLQQGYSEYDITILSMYYSQVKKIRKQLQDIKRANVKVFTVDSFQGQENKIIILSCVRSNKSGLIGFTGLSNRVCVALSRAKSGFYCIGNFQVSYINIVDFV